MATLRKESTFYKFIYLNHVLDAMKQGSSILTSIPVRIFWIFPNLVQFNRNPWKWKPEHD